MSNNLLPDVDTPVVVNGVVSHRDEAGMAALEPRANGTGSITISGTDVAADVLTLTFASKLFATSIAINVTDVTSDTNTLLAERLAEAIMANATLVGFGLIAEADPVAGKVVLTWPGPLGSFVTMSFGTTGAEVGTIVQISGGSGPIIPTKHFNFIHNGFVIQFVQNRRKQLSADTLAALVAAGPQPII